MCIDLREKERERERERNIDWLPPRNTHPNQGFNVQPLGVCPDQESNPQPLGVWGLSLIHI